MGNKIEVQDFSFYYGDFQALIDLNVPIKDRQITALIGPSGCGKSTFLRSLNRMNDTIAGTRAAGQVLLDGKNIYDPDVDVADLRQRVGMVFQRPNPFPQSIYDNVAFGPRVLGMTKNGSLDQIVQDSLRGAALWNEVKHRLKDSALDLNPGQQQRLCIARSLALEPEVLLLDEPTSGLDPISTGVVEESLFELKRTHTMVIVPHSVQQAGRVSDYAAFLLMGELVEHALGGGLFAAPRDQRTEDYVTGRFG